MNCEICLQEIYTHQAYRIVSYGKYEHIGNCNLLNKEVEKLRKTIGCSVCEYGFSVPINTEVTGFICENCKSKQMFIQPIEGHLPSCNLNYEHRQKQGCSCSKMIKNQEIFPRGERIRTERPKEDIVNHPNHYNKHPSGIECIEVVRHMNYNRGKAMAYIWRAGEKMYSANGNQMTLLESEIYDLNKAIWHLKDEVKSISGKFAPYEKKEQPL